MSKSWGVVDLSHPLAPSTPPFPGDPGVEIEVLDAIAGAPSDGKRHLNCSRVSTCIHCGTHMDAPFHFFADGRTIEQVPLEECIGPAVRISHPDWQANSPIEPRHLESHESAIRTTRRVILQTGWDRRWMQAEYFSDHPVITGAAGQWLVDRGVVLVGVDFPSVDRAPYPAHEVLLGNGLVIVENLTKLDTIPAAVFEFSAIPLPIVGRDGSPVRAFARPLSVEMNA
jgi:kynurenine formamidase